MAHNQSEEHTALVKAALEALALNGYTAWQTNTGAYKTDTGGFIKYGKKGGGDLTGVLPPHGRHFEGEAKTGNATQTKTQKDHQKYCIEINGGIYILFRSVEALLFELGKFRC